MTKSFTAMACSALLASSIAGCGGGDGKGRIAAVQAMLDASPPDATIQDGTDCLDRAGADAEHWRDWERYSHVPDISVKTTAAKNSMGMTCRTFVWSSDAGVHVSPRNGSHAVAIGRFVVDQVGNDKDAAGVAAAPFKAHFESNAMGKSLIDAGIATALADLSGQATLHKDADGKWTAQ